MNKKEKALFISEKLEELFPEPAIPLDHSSPYTLLIAVLLSAQCTDQRVNLVTPALFKLADTPEKMVQLSIKQIEDKIRTCGLAPTKAAAIFNLSQKILTEFRGDVPQTFEALESLPGVGHKTASVVMSQAFQQPAFPVDTHIFRAAKRWGLSKGTTVTAVEKDLKKLFPKSKWNALHLQIIYFCRAYCPAKAHNINECPICSVLQ